MLNPFGSHKCGDIFLRKFLQTCEYDDNFIDELLSNARVTVTPNEYGRSESDQIDILVLNQYTRHAFFIENKINARDSNHDDRGQLEGYYETLLGDYNIPAENINMVFLTMFGREPSDESYGTRHNEEIRNKCRIRTYNQLVIPWLERCLCDCIDKPFLRESILQYIKLIKKMTNDISIEERLELAKLIGKNEDNLKATKLLVENFKHIKWHAVADFWNELSERLEGVGCTVCEDELDLDTITFLTHNEDYKHGYSNKVLYMTYECPSGLTFYILYQYGEPLCFCVDKIKENRAFRESLKSLLNTDDNYGSDSETILWKFFDLPFEEEIRFSDFTHEGTFNIISPEYRKKIIGKLVTEIKDVFCSVDVWK